MSHIFAQIIPIFIVIVTGHLLWRANLFGEETWTAIGNICYFLLFPCLLIKTLAKANFADLPLGALVFAMIGTILIISMALILIKAPLSKLFNISNASYTSIFQGATRWHGFMALAIVSGLYGDKGVTIIAVAIAAMVPLLNVINVAVLTIWGDQGDKGQLSTKYVLQQISQNPFIIACAIGVLINISGLQIPKSVNESLTIMGDGALGLSLLAIGAALRLERIQATLAALMTGVLVRLICMPLTMLLITEAVGLTGIEQTVSVIAAAVPTAASSYVLAQKMGGDTTLMANIITLQVILSALTLPLAIKLSEML